MSVLSGNRFFIRNRDQDCHALLSGCIVFLVILLLLTLIPSVSAFDPETIVWSQAVSHAEFGDRYLMGTAVFAGKMWVIGGIASSGNMNDVWYSADGVTWQLACEHASFSPRHAFATAVFDNKLWVIGGDSAGEAGLNDVWYSDDGVTWTEATAHAPFLPREGATLTVYDGKLWVIGGGTKGNPRQSTWDLTNDVWSSPDGVEWTEATGHAGFPPRADHSTVSFEGKLWVIAGWDGNTYFNDIWYSSDGVTWTRVPGRTLFSLRVGQRSAVYDDKIWLTGGRFFSTFLNEVWYTSDGMDWKEVGNSTPFSPREAHSLLVFDNRLWVIGGTQGPSALSDVWYSSPPATSTSDTAVNGTGTSPVNGVIVTKTISPVSIKQGTDGQVTIVVTNTGLSPVHDIEILDTTLPEFPVVTGETKYVIPEQLESNETRILRYTVQVTKPGTYVLNKTLVMYAGEDGNYHMSASNAPVVVVLEPLIPSESAEPASFFSFDVGKIISGFFRMFG
jgi:N-acetylneuraminic acid mutarotase